MNSELRADVWNDMVDTDRLARYYGELAGKLASKEQWMAVITTVLAMISLATALSPAGSWTILPVALTVASSVLPLVYRVSGVVTAAAYRQQRLGDLLIQWKALWQEIDNLPPDQVREQWRRMAREQNEARLAIPAIQAASGQGRPGRWRRMASGQEATATTTATRSQEAGSTDC